MTTWTDAHKQLVWCTERQAAVIAFWMSYSSAVVIIAGRLMHETWGRYGWETHPARRP